MAVVEVVAYYCGMTIGLVTLPMHCLVIYILLANSTKSDLRCAFFKLSTFGCIVDVLSLLNTGVGFVQVGLRSVLQRLRFTNYPMILM